MIIKEIKEIIIIIKEKKEITKEIKGKTKEIKKEIIIIIYTEDASKSMKIASN